MITGKNYVGNQLSAKGNKIFTTFNPVLNTKNSWTHTEASKEEINEAVTLASKAYEEFKNISGKDKAAFLNLIADELLALDNHLIKTYCLETGLPEGRAQGERSRTVFQLRSFAELVAEGSWVEATIDTPIPDRTPASKPDLRKMNIPIGPVVVFGAAIKKLGMPNGVFSHLNSSGIAVGQQLVKHPKVKAVGFTGSIRGGRALLDLAAQRNEPIPVFAEMGSVNPVVILPEALQSRNAELAKNYANSINLGTGQFCTNPGLIFGLKSKALDQFIEHLGREIQAKESTVMLHPNILEAYEASKSKALSQPKTTVVTHTKDKMPANYAQQAILTVQGADFLENHSLHQEVFGPFSLIVQCESLRELESIIANLEGQLTGTLIANSTEINQYQTLISALQNRVGRLIYNGVPTGVEVCPSMVHGGTYPASTDSRFTAVGIHSIKRWVRPFSYQDWRNQRLPDELKNENPLGISRLINGEQSTRKI